MCIQMSITETPRKRPTASRNNKLSKKIIKDYPKKILYEPSGNTLVSKFHQLSMKKEKTKRKKLINKPNVFYRLYEDALNRQKKQKETLATYSKRKHKIEKELCRATQLITSKLYEDARRRQKNVSNSKTDSIKLSQTKKLVHPDLWEIHNVDKITWENTEKDIFDRLYDDARERQKNSLCKKLHKNIKNNNQIDLGHNFSISNGKLKLENKQCKHI